VKSFECLFYNNRQLQVRGLRGLVICAGLFSFAYAIVEYYIIQDTTFGLKPILFSLLYPYHLAMALVFGIAAYSFLTFHTGHRPLLSALILSGALFSSMLVAEDFMWFALRAAAPLDHDLNAGRLVTQGEWSTQFLGSVDVRLTAIPNWYFVNVAFTLTVFGIAKGRRPVTEIVAQST